MSFLLPSQQCQKHWRHFGLFLIRWRYFIDIQKSMWVNRDVKSEGPILQSWSWTWSYSEQYFLQPYFSPPSFTSVEYNLLPRWTDTETTTLLTNCLNHLCVKMELVTCSCTVRAGCHWTLIRPAASTSPVTTIWHYINSIIIIIIIIIVHIMMLHMTAWLLRELSSWHL